MILEIQDRASQYGQKKWLKTPKALHRFTYRVKLVQIAKVKQAPLTHQNNF